MSNTHESQCKVCAYGAEKIDWTQNKSSIARQVGVDHKSVSRHMKWVEVNGFELGTTNTTTFGHQFPESPVPGQWIPRRHWQTPGDGEPMSSWQFVPDDFDVSLDNERIDSLIRDVPQPAERPTKRNGLPELALPADLQLGKHERGIGTVETMTKFYTSMQRVAERWMTLQPREGYLCDMGDLIENIYSTASQAATNDRTVPQQVEDAIALYMNAIGLLLPLTDSLTFATVTSNHGEARSAMKVNPYDSENDWGLFIQRQLRNRCEDRGWNVNFVRPDEYEDTAVIRTTEGTVVALTHGHHSGTPTKMENWITGQIVGQCPGHDADIWVHGHYHNPTHFSVGRGIDVFGTPSLDPSSEWFAKKTGKRARQGIVAFTVDKGDWSNYSIL